MLFTQVNRVIIVSTYLSDIFKLTITYLSELFLVFIKVFIKIHKINFIFIYL